MKDTWGQELAVGDEVCVVRKTGRYVNNIFGVVTGFTPSGHLAKIKEHNAKPPFDEFKAGERIFKKPL